MKHWNKACKQKLIALSSVQMLFSLQFSPDSLENVWLLLEYILIKFSEEHGCCLWKGWPEMQRILKGRVCKKKKQTNETVQVCVCISHTFLTINGLDLAHSHFLCQPCYPLISFGFWTVDHQQRLEVTEEADIWWLRDNFGCSPVFT